MSAATQPTIEERCHKLARFLDLIDAEMTSDELIPALLTDLRHYCHRNGGYLNFNAMLRTSEKRFQAELAAANN